MVLRGQRWLPVLQETCSDAWMVMEKTSQAGYRVYIIGLFLFGHVWLVGGLKKEKNEASDGL